MARRQRSLSIEQLLDSSLPKVSSVAKQQTRLRRMLADTLTHVLCQSLSAALLNSCHLLYIGKQHISFACDTASVATQLRFHSPSILKALNKVLVQHQKPQLSEIKIRVTRKPTTPAPATPTSPSYSASAATWVGEVAASIDDPALNQSLATLARHLKQR